MAFTLNFTNEELRRASQCVICYEAQKSNTYTVCTGCKCIVCLKCSVRQSKKCPQNCRGEWRLERDNTLNAFLDLINSKVNKDGRPLNCEGGLSLAHKVHDQKYTEARREYDERVENARKILQIQEEAQCFFIKIQRKLKDSRINELAAKYVGREGRTFCDRAEDIGSFGTEDAARRLVSDTEYFLETSWELLDRIDMPKFSTNTVELAFVLSTNIHFIDLLLNHHCARQHDTDMLCDGATKECREFVAKFTPAFEKGGFVKILLEFSNADENNDANDDDDGYYSFFRPKQMRFLKYCCYFYAIEQGLKGDLSHTTNDLEFVVQTLYECGFVTSKNLLFACIEQLKRTATPINVVEEDDFDDFDDLPSINWRLNDID